MSGVLVCHPGLQHSHQLAWALHAQGMLAGFWSGIPVRSDGSNFWRYWPLRWRQKIKRIEVPASLCRHPIVFPVIYRLMARFPRAWRASEYIQNVDYAFDRWAANRLSAVNATAVVAYENASLETFKAAKAAGLICILDAASFHHATASKLNPRRHAKYLQQINRRKEEEIALADWIIVCSDVAAESYRAAGVPSEKIRVVPLGADLYPVSTKWEVHEKPLHFVFAGALRRLKGIDVIVDAFSLLYQEGLPFRLTFVGAEAEPGWISRIKTLAGTSHVHQVPQQSLFEILAKADCLLLPSRYDAFGMVVAEAMAQGTPAIVSTQTGAKEMILDEPGAGWIVPCATEALANCVRQRINDREGMASARSFALRVARKYTWDAYRMRSSRIISSLLN